MVFALLVASALEVESFESMLLVRWRLGARWSLHLKEPACVVGEHKQIKQLLLAELGCLVSPDVGDTISVSCGVSTFISFLLLICSLSIQFSSLKLSPPARANSRIMLCTHKMQNETIIVCNSMRNCYLWTLVMFLIDPESTPQKWRSSKRKRWHWEWLKMTICFIYFSITGIIIDSINVPPRYITFVVDASTTPPN